MKRINSDVIKIIYENDNSSITVFADKKMYTIKRQTYNEKKECRIIDIVYLDESVKTIKRLKKYNATREEINLSNQEKGIIIDEIFDELNNSNLVRDAFDLEKFKNVIKQTFLNILISDGILGLSGNVNTLYKSHYSIDVVDVINNKIIGDITISNDDVVLNLSDEERRQSLKLLNKMLCLYCSKELDYNSGSIKIKSLVLNS